MTLLNYLASGQDHKVDQSNIVSLYIASSPYCNAATHQSRNMDTPVRQITNMRDIANQAVNQTIYGDLIQSVLDRILYT